MSIKEILFEISTCGPLGKMYGGGLIASLLAIPLIFICQLLNWLSPSIHLVLHGSALLVALLAMYVAVRTTSEYNSSAIVLDKVIGLSIVYCCIPFSIKLYVIGFLCFHIANVVLPWAITKAWDLHLDQLPNVAGIIASDLLAGVSVHLLLRIVVWLAH